MRFIDQITKVCQPTYLPELFRSMPPRVKFISLPFWGTALCTPYPPAISSKMSNLPRNEGSSKVSDIQASTLAEQRHQTQTQLILSVQCWPVASPKASGISPLVTKFYEAFKQVLCTLMFFFCYLVSVELICSEIVLTLHLFSMRKLSQTPLQPPFYEKFSIMHVTSKAKKRSINIQSGCQLTGSFLKKTNEVRVRMNHLRFHDFQPIPAPSHNNQAPCH